MQEYIFLNNASFGLYTNLIRHRERATSYFGRMRIIAAIAAAYSLFSIQKLFYIKMDVGEKENVHKTSMVFIGNNTLQLDKLGIEVAECTKKNKLAVIIMKEVNRFEIAHFLLRGIIGSLKDDYKLTQLCTDNFEVETNRKIIDLVVDGEIVRCNTPLKFSIEKDALNIITPAAE